MRAIVRHPSPALRDCALTFLERQPIDFANAQTQHRAYIAALRQLGVDVFELAVDEHLPDSVFVEDTAVVLDEVAVITRPGIATRQPETASIEAALRRFRPLVTIEQPGTIEGGDVLRIGRTLFVGQTARTNADGTRQLAEAITAHGYEVVPVVPSGCLHLKSAVTYAGRETVILNPDWIDVGLFARWQCVRVPLEEPSGANVLLVNDTVHVAASAPATRRKLSALGFETTVLDTSEFEKAEAALTCLSLLFT
ncbi:MAG: arginine deiminase family protein [Vicinamibacterales bacterium]